MISATIPLRRWWSDRMTTLWLWPRSFVSNTTSILMSYRPSQQISATSKALLSSLVTAWKRTLLFTRTNRTWWIIQITCADPEANLRKRVNWTVVFRWVEAKLTNLSLTNHQQPNKIRILLRDITFLRDCISNLGRSKPQGQIIIHLRGGRVVESVWWLRTNLWMKALFRVAFRSTIKIQS